jgi:anti-sigma factor RsiW
MASSGGQRQTETNMPDRGLIFDAHEQFSELCSLYPTGALSAEELAALQEHLSACEECRTRLLTYRRIASEAVPLLDPCLGNESAPNLSFPLADAKRALYAELDRRKRGTEEPSVEFPTKKRTRPQYFGLLGWQVSRSRALQVSMIIVGLLLAFAIFTMWRAKKTVEGPILDAERSSPAPANHNLAALAAERDALNARLKDRDARIETLSAQIAGHLKEISRLKQISDDYRIENTEIKSQLSSTRAEQDAMKDSRSSVEGQLAQAQDSLIGLRKELSSIQAQRRDEILYSVSLETRVAQLSAEAKDQQSFLSSDRDIRELMGARDLYIADVFDVDPDSHTQKPFGRVFYTKKKSLIFYAFDLDQQRGLKSVSAFQAWGLGDSDKKHPLNLGIFYQDNQANRRWMLKFEDPAALAKINAVFVTIEPPGGSAKPSGKQLLYAYLSNQPNHP